jgi:hypothetical protein
MKRAKVTANSDGTSGSWDRNGPVAASIDEIPNKETEMGKSKANRTDLI